MHWGYSLLRQLFGFEPGIVRHDEVAAQSQLDWFIAQFLNGGPDAVEDRQSRRHSCNDPPSSPNAFARAARVEEIVKIYYVLHGDKPIRLFGFPNYSPEFRIFLHAGHKADLDVARESRQPQDRRFGRICRHASTAEAVAGDGIIGPTAIGGCVDGDVPGSLLGRDTVVLGGGGRFDFDQQNFIRDFQLCLTR
jgi:hypothetical protein